MFVFKTEKIFCLHITRRSLFEGNYRLMVCGMGILGHFHLFSSQKAGVCFLFISHFSFEITKYFIDPLGRFILDIEKGKKGGNAKTHTRSRERLRDHYNTNVRSKWCMERNEPGWVQIHVKKKEV